jgi:hypothetical protein
MPRHPDLPWVAFALSGAVLLGAEASSPVAAAFGATIVSTYPDGRTAELYLQRDGGYTARGRRADGSSGRWKVNDGKLCLSQSSPFPSPFDYCTPVPDRGLNTTWSAKAVTGETIQVKLVKGHFLGKAKLGADDGAEKQKIASRRN